MIRVTRGPEPAVLTRSRDKWLAAVRVASTPATRRAALSKYKHSEVRDALCVAFRGKCAYCESTTEVATWGHIEHYRPKSAFPESAFDWENLLWTCPQCNSGCKGDQFPEAADGGPLVNPCAEEPGDHFVFDWDPVARLANVDGATRRGETTVAVLQLNRPALRQERSRQVARIAALSHLAADHPEAKRLLEEAKADDAPYAAFARQF